MPELDGAPSGHKPEAVRAAVVKQKGLVPVQNHKAGASQVVLLSSGSLSGPKPKV